jgi:dTMP kinase
MADQTQGYFLAIEGSDGSGKATQTDLIAKKLKELGYQVATISFPRYAAESSYFVRNYLEGKYGSGKDVGPYSASVFYALDRYDYSELIANSIKSGKIVLANRFSASNMAHQGSKIPEAKTRREFYVWLDSLEHTMLKIPKPNRNILLNLEQEKLTDNLKKRFKLTKKTDIHESDKEHVIKTAQIYREVVELYPNDFLRIDCVRRGQLLSPGTICDEIIKKIEPLLPATKKGAKGSIVELADENGDGVKQRHGASNDTDRTIDESGLHQTSNSEQRDKEVAEALLKAHAASRSNETHESLLEEINGHDSRKKVQFVLRDLSILAYFELKHLAEKNTTITSISSQKSAKTAKHPYYIPDNLDKESKEVFVSTIEQNLESYHNLVNKLNAHSGHNKSKKRTSRAISSLQQTLPCASNIDVTLSGRIKDVEKTIIKLMASELREARNVGQKLLEAGRALNREAFEKTDRPEYGGKAMLAYASNHVTTKKSSRQILKEKHPKSTGSIVSIVKYTPKNELDLLTSIIYKHSNLSYVEIEESLRSVVIDDKYKLLETSFIDKSSYPAAATELLDNLHYEVEFNTQTLSALNLIDIGNLMLTHQALTPTKRLWGR